VRRRPKLPVRPADDGRIDQLLAIVESFTGAGRGVPGHVLRELVRLRPQWGKRDIPSVVVAAGERLR
jgi:hypothetical protein